LQTNFAGILLQHHFLFFMSKILNTAKKANMEQYDSGFQESGRKKKAPISTQHKIHNATKQTWNNIVNDFK